MQIYEQGRSRIILIVKYMNEKYKFLSWTYLLLISFIIIDDKKVINYIITPLSGTSIYVKTEVNYILFIRWFIYHTQYCFISIIIFENITNKLKITGFVNINMKTT